MAKGDTRLERSDIAKAMYNESNGIFMDVLKNVGKEEWKDIVHIKKSTRKEEKYETVGNLKPAEVKAEGDSVVYGDIIEGNTTTVTNDTIANGLQVTMEAEEDDQWGIVDAGKTTELARTMLDKREQLVAAIYDNGITDVGADGVTIFATNHDLLNSASTNSNLVNKVFNTTVYGEAVNMFHHWKNHTGEKFNTKPTAILAHADRQTEILAMLQSALMAFENTNTKNTIRQLRPIFNTYLATLPVYIIDEAIDSAIFQRRKGLTTQYDYDKRGTFNWYFNVHERYKPQFINPGFGIVRINGEVRV